MIIFAEEVSNKQRNMMKLNKTFLTLGSGRSTPADASLIVRTDCGR